MSKKKDTLVVNLLAGPGTGKSTIAAGVFSELKWRKIDCEVAFEFAKDLVWEHRHKTFTNQIYLFGKQHHRIFRLLGEVNVVITDSPIILTPVYDPNQSTHLKQLALEEHHRYRSLNIFLNRKKDYNPNGRNQTLSEAQEVDEKIKKFLIDNSIEHTIIDAVKENITTLTDTIISKI